MRSRYRHIIWDWNGTLLDDAALSVELVNLQLRRWNIPEISVEQHRHLFRFPIREYYRNLGVDLAAIRFEDIQLDWHASYESRHADFALHDYATDLLAALRNCGVEHSILSAHGQQALCGAVELMGIAGHFADIIGQHGNPGESKIDNGHRLMKSITHAAREVVLIGDTVHDFEVASALSIDSILVSHGHQARRKLEECGAPVVDSLRELQQYLFIAGT